MVSLCLWGREVLRCGTVGPRVAWLWEIRQLLEQTSLHPASEAGQCSRLMSRVQASPAFLSVQAVQEACLLHIGPQDWDTQSVA